MSAPPTPLHSGPDQAELPRGQMPVQNIDLNPELDSDDEPRISAWTHPFESVYASLKQAFYSTAGEAFSHQQQSQFVAYADGEILQIQRRFIKFQADPANAYPLETLLTDVWHVTDFVWRSVNARTPLFGQQEYYLRLFGDLEEWLEYYALPPADEAFYGRFFSFFQALDTQVSFLADGYTAHNGASVQSRLSPTELVRLAPLVTRLRLLIVSKVEGVRDGSDVMDIEIGRLFEGLLERL